MCAVCMYSQNPQLAKCIDFLKLAILILSATSLPKNGDGTSSKSRPFLFWKKRSGVALVNFINITQTGSYCSRRRVSQNLICGLTKLPLPHFCAEPRSI